MSQGGVSRHAIVTFGGNNAQINCPRGLLCPRGTTLLICCPSGELTISSSAGVYQMHIILAQCKLQSMLDWLRLPINDVFRRIPVIIRRCKNHLTTHTGARKFQHAFHIIYYCLPLGHGTRRFLEWDWDCSSCTCDLHVIASSSGPARTELSLCFAAFASSRFRSLSCSEVRYIFLELY